MVHQRRQVVSALQAKAMIVAMVNPQEASKAATAYLDVALPTDPEENMQRDLLKEAALEAIGKLGPISLSDIKLSR
jgi:hypothetical protein